MNFDDIMLSIPQEARAVLMTAFFMALGALIGVISWRAARRRQKRESDAEWEKRIKFSPELIKQDIIRKLENEAAYWRGRADILQERLREYVPIFQTAAIQMKRLADDASERATE